jgi:hypothetical protein
MLVVPARQATSKLRHPQTAQLADFVPLGSTALMRQQLLLSPALNYITAKSVQVHLWLVSTARSATPPTSQPKRTSLIAPRVVTASKVKKHFAMLATSATRALPRPPQLMPRLVSCVLKASIAQQVQSLALTVMLELTTPISA